MIDSESHLLWCEAYGKLRENKDLKNDKDLCQYLQEILSLRTKEELEKEKQRKNQEKDSQ